LCFPFFVKSEPARTAFVSHASRSLGWPPFFGADVFSYWVVALDISPK